MTTTYTEKTSLIQDAEKAAGYPTVEAPPPYQQQPAGYAYASSSTATYAYPPPGTQVLIAPAPKKSNACCACCGTTIAILCGVFCCLLVSAGIIVGSIYGVAYAKCHDLTPVVDSSTSYTSSSPRVAQVYINAPFGDIVVTPNSTLNKDQFMMTVAIAAPEEFPDAFPDAIYTDRSGNGVGVTFSDYDHLPWPKYLCQQMEIAFVYPSGGFNNQITAVSLDWTTVNSAITLSDLPFDLSTSSVTTANAPIRLSYLSSPSSLEAKTSNSRIEGSHLKGLDYTLTTTNAQIELDDVSAQSIAARTSNSRIEAYEVRLFRNDSASSCGLDFDTSNASINVRVTMPPANVDCTLSLSTSNSRVEITLYGFAGTFDMQTSNGKVDSVGPSCGSSSCTGSWGSGQHKLFIQTTNSNIEVEFR